ncbi:melanopsin-B-like [Oculina patagonica]
MDLTCNASWLNISSNSSDSSNWLNQNVSAHLSACGEFGARRPPPINPFEDFYKAAFGSAIFMFVVSFTTVLANSLLLLIFCIDPLKIFRNTTTYFLIGLAIVDLLTGLVQEPIYATCFIFLYLRHPLTPKCQPYMQFAHHFATFSITVSLVIVFAFTVTQYIVVASPLKYGRLVTKKKVLISVVFIYVYTAIFSCLPLMGVSEKVHDAITLFLHSYAVVLVTIVFYILLHYTMKRKMAAANSLQNESTSRQESNHTKVQRNFVRLNVILLIVLIVCFVPTMIMMTIRLYMEEHLAPYWQKVLIANLMTDNLHYLKFLLDPFVYAWRMPKYRESLSKIICRKNIAKKWRGSERESKSTTGSRVSELTTVELNKSEITLLSFKNISVD